MPRVIRLALSNAQFVVPWPAEVPMGMNEGLALPASLTRRQGAQRRGQQVCLNFGLVAGLETLAKQLDRLDAGQIARHGADDHRRGRLHPSGWLTRGGRGAILSAERNTTLNRAGDFTLSITVTDRVGKNTTEFEAPLHVAGS